MASHLSDDEEDEVSKKELSYDNDVQEAIYELLNEYKIMYKTVSIQKKQISSLEEKIDAMKKYFDKETYNYFDKEKTKYTCNECNSLSFQIFQLKSC